MSERSDALGEAAIVRSTGVQIAGRGIPPLLFGVLVLPGGLGRGFVTVTLAYLLAHNGVSVAAIAALVSLYVLPETLKFLIGPALDLTLSPTRWYAMMVTLGVAILTAFALTPLTPAAMPLLTGLAFLLSCAFTAAGSSTTAAMALTTPQAHRGAVAGWQQAATLGGIGLGGGLGLWLANHAGGQKTAALSLAAISLLCMWPLLRLRAPRPAHDQPIARQALELTRTMWALARTREGVLAILAVSLPAALGAATSLLAAVAGDWHASGDLVALVLGVVSGLASLPGCILGGYLCDLFPRRTVYVLTAMGCGLCELAMAAGPHTPAAFAIFVILNALLLGCAWAAVSAVVYEQLGAKAAATLAAVLSSFSNLPVAVVTVIVGRVQTSHGSGAMLAVEGGLGVASMLAYALLAWLWRPVSVAALRPVAA
jgi:PAT family beta-lactamase induction signal transducer AmpG